MFLGDDWQNIRHYREFEIAPTGDWIDLAIDLDHAEHDLHLALGLADGWPASISARISGTPPRAFPLRPYQHGGHSGHAMADEPVSHRRPGRDPQRHFLCWQPTCVVDHDPNHVPETLRHARVRTVNERG